MTARKFGLRRKETHGRVGGTREGGLGRVGRSEGSKGGREMYVMNYTKKEFFLIILPRNICIPFESLALKFGSQEPAFFFCL